MVVDIAYAGSHVVAGISTNFLGTSNGIRTRAATLKGWKSFQNGSRVGPHQERY